MARKQSSTGTATVGRGLVLAYGLPGLPLAFAGGALAVYAPSYYADELGLGLAATGLALTVARVWDIAIGPLIGALSDRTPARFGRRRPWLLAGMAVTLIAARFVFAPAEGAGFVYLLLAAMALYAGLALVHVPYLAWGAELSPAYDARTRIAASREGLMVLGVLAIAALTAALAWTSASFGVGAAADAMAAVFWAVALVLPMSLAVLLGAVPEPIQKSAGRRRPWRHGLANILGNGPFLRLLAVALVNGLANGLTATLFLLYVGHVLGQWDAAGLLLAIYLGCAVVAMPFWARLSERYDRHRVWAAAMLVAALALGSAALLGAGDVLPFVLACAIAGSALGAELMLAPAILADVVDLDRLRGGGARAGVYFGLWSSVGKVSLALALGFAFPVLALAGMRLETGTADETGLAALAALFGLAPMLCKIVAAGLVWRFPIGRVAQADIRRRIGRQGAGPGRVRKRAAGAARSPARSGRRPRRGGGRGDPKK